MRGFGFGRARHARRPPGGVATPTLGALSLAASGIIENSAAGTVVGGVLGRTIGSTLALVDSAGGRFALAGGNLVAGGTGTDYETATSHGITIRETLAGYANSPRDTVLTVSVGNAFEQPSLAALGLSATSMTIGAAASGSVTGATTGSTIAATGLPSGLTVNGAARTWSWSGTGTADTSTVTLTETLTDSANSPRTNGVGVTIASASFAALPRVQAKRAAGQRAVIAMMGDSVTAGWGAGATTGTGAGGTPGTGGGFLKSGSHPHQLAALLDTAGIPARSDAYFSGIQNGMSVADIGASESRVTFGSGWSNSGIDSLGGSIVTCADASAMTFTPEVAADRFDIIVTGYAGLGTFTVTDSAGTLATIDETVASGGVAVGPSYCRKVTVSRATASTATISLQRTGGGGIYVIGIVPYDSTSPRIELVNMGWPGACATAGGLPSWQTQDSAWSPFNAGAVVGADAWAIELGANDAYYGVSNAVFQSAIDALVGQCASFTADVLLIKPHTATDAFNVPAGYLIAIDDVSTARSLPTPIDFNAIGLVTADRYDSIHLARPGYAKEAAVLKAYFAP